MDTNEVRIRGNLGADPKVFNEPNQEPFAVFDIATNLQFRSRNGEQVDRTEWHHVAAYGWRAEIAKHFTKGMKVHIEGYLRTREFDQRDGKGKATEIVALDLHEVKLAPKAATSEIPANVPTRIDSPSARAPAPDHRQPAYI